MASIWSFCPQTRYDRSKQGRAVGGWSVDAVTLVAGSLPIRQRFREAGVTGNEVGIFSGLMDARSIFLTANAGTTYFRYLDDWQLDDLPVGLAVHWQRGTR